jgi:GT2 family glycosyltransferase
VLRDVAVLIPTLGRDILEASLAAIAAGTRWPGELILVDQGANPRVETWAAMLTAAGLPVTHLRAPRRGRAAALNRGLERVEARFVLVTDDDCLAEPHWVAAMGARLATSPAAIITGRVEGGAGVVAVVTSQTPAVHRRPRLRYDAMSGGNMGAAIEVLRRVGPFDEDPCLATAEDGEFAYRALRAGVEIVYDPTAGVLHLGWRNADERGAQYDSYARSLGAFFGKYVRRGDWFIAVRTCLHLARTAKRWARGVLTRDRELAANGRAYVIGLLPGFRAGWKSTAPTPQGTAP